MPNSDLILKLQVRLAIAAEAFTDSFMHLTRPFENFPYYTNEQIKMAWSDWEDEKEILDRVTGAQPVARDFPEPPPDYDSEYEPCRQMWACLLQEKVGGRDGLLVFYLKHIVAHVQIAEQCKSHPSTCYCKAQKNLSATQPCSAPKEPPFLSDILAMRRKAEEAANIRKGGGQKLLKEAARTHPKLCACIVCYEAQFCDYPYCRCEGHPTELKSTYDYDHRVETCACGTCATARENSK